MSVHNAPERKPPQSVSPEADALLDSEQAAAIIQIHPKTLQKFARSGAIKGILIGKLWRFRRSAIDHWLDQQAAS